MSRWRWLSYSPLPILNTEQISLFFTVGILSIQIQITEPYNRKKKKICNLNLFLEENFLHKEKQMFKFSSN